MRYSISGLSAALFLINLKVWLSRLFVASLVVLLILAIAAIAASAGSLANPAIDQMQGEIADWVADGAVTVFFGLASWFGGWTGIRVVERLNRATIREAAERFANMMIDQAQARYLDAEPAAINDLVNAGVDYIKSGNPGTVKQAKIKDDRIGAYVTEAIQQVRAARSLIAAQ